MSESTKEARISVPSETERTPQRSVPSGSASLTRTWPSCAGASRRPAGPSAPTRTTSSTTTGSTEAATSRPGSSPSCSPRNSEPPSGPCAERSAHVRGNHHRWLSWKRSRPAPPTASSTRPRSSASIRPARPRRRRWSSPSTPTCSGRSSPPTCQRSRRGDGRHPATGRRRGVQRCVRTAGLENVAVLGGGRHPRQGRRHRRGPVHGPAGGRRPRRGRGLARAHGRAPAGGGRPHRPGRLGLSLRSPADDHEHDSQTRGRRRR
jgi:hypothetical protein